MSTVLIADDDLAICKTLTMHYQHLGFDVVDVNTVDDALAVLGQRPVDAVISDVRMPGRDGLSLLNELRETKPDLPVIMMTAFHDLDMTVKAIQAGAADYVPKPLDIDELDQALDRALAKNDHGADDDLIVGEETATSGVIGSSRLMKELFKEVAMVSERPVTVLLRGESGTGKEVVAQAIHMASQNAKDPFLAINCAALVENLLESELFGHEKGAFTSAHQAHKGKVEMVGSGTLFLDEIAEITPAMQSKLLRLLEAREYSPVGSTKILNCHCRFLAATNKDLEQEVAEGRFREDLFYRLNVVTITLPPLRDRLEDIPALVRYLLGRINRDVGCGITRVTAETIDCLQSHDWPGNVRELDNVLMKAVVMVRGDTMTADALPDKILQASDKTADDPDLESPRLCMPCSPSETCRLSIKDMERRHIKRVLQVVEWHKGKACQILGISRPRLDRRIKEFGLRP